MDAPDLVHIDVVSCAGETTAPEWEARAVEAELRNVGLLRSKYTRDAFVAVEGTLGAAAWMSEPRGLVLTISLGPWEPPAPSTWDTGEPPPVRPRPIPRPEPPAPVPS